MNISPRTSSGIFRTGDNKALWFMICSDISLCLQDSCFSTSWTRPMSSSSFERSDLQSEITLPMLFASVFEGTPQVPKVLGQCDDGMVGSEMDRFIK